MLRPAGVEVTWIDAASAPVRTTRPRRLDLVPQAPRRLAAPLAVGRHPVPGQGHLARGKTSPCPRAVRRRVEVT